MAAPLSGIGQQQQVPLSQTFQPGGNDQAREVRKQNQEPRENEIQAKSAASAQSQKTNHETDSSFLSNVENAMSAGNNEPSNAQGRGTVVDITV